MNLRQLVQYVVDPVTVHIVLGLDKPQQVSDRCHIDNAVLELILADGSLYEHKGKVDFIDRDIDPTTGAMLVQASFPNLKQFIRPGQFAKTRAQLSVVENGILIPQRCVMELQGRDRIYIVNSENKVESRDVVTGAKVKNFWLITQGLVEGEMVVFEGLQKVRENLTVLPKIVQVDQIN